MALQKSVKLVPSCFVIKILLHPLASRTDGSAPSLFLTAAFFTKSASIVSNAIGCTCLEVSVSKTPSSAFLPCRCFALTGSRFFDLIDLALHVISK